MTTYTCEACGDVSNPVRNLRVVVLQRNKYIGRFQNIALCDPCLKNNTILWSRNIVKNFLISSSKTNKRKK
jgi:hypothetical protein